MYCSLYSNKIRTLSVTQHYLESDVTPAGAPDIAAGLPSPADDGLQ